MEEKQLRASLVSLPVCPQSRRGLSRGQGSGTVFLIDYCTTVEWSPFLLCLDLLGDLGGVTARIWESLSF